MTKQNLKKYSEKFDPILETKIFTKKECERIVNTLIKRQNEWEVRSPIGDFFMSYGALTYLDAEGGYYESYTQKSKYFNEILMEDFDWMYSKIKSYYEERFEKPVVFKYALPGFHIFQTAEMLNHEHIKNSASIHVDLPHRPHEWDSDILAVSSFTIAVKLPRCGAGLNIWQDKNVFDNIETVFFDELDEKNQLKVTESAEYFPYKLGYIYEQSGLTRHQITCKGEVMENERRVTLQGHIVETDKEIILYV